MHFPRNVTCISRRSAARWRKAVRRLVRSCREAFRSDHVRSDHWPCCI